jgi:hypothetical protein
VHRLLGHLLRDAAPAVLALAAFSLGAVVTARRSSSTIAARARVRMWLIFALCGLYGFGYLVSRFGRLYVWIPYLVVGLAGLRSLRPRPHRRSTARPAAVADHRVVALPR